MFVILGCQATFGQQSLVCDSYLLAGVGADDADRADAEYSFDEIMTIPSEYDDNFAVAVIAVSEEQRAIIAKIEKDWSWDMHFTSAGKWFFHRGNRELLVRHPESGEIVAGPFRYDINREGFAYDAATQRLATVENNDMDEETGRREIVVHHFTGRWGDHMAVQG